MDIVDTRAIGDIQGKRPPGNKGQPAILGVQTSLLKKPSKLLKRWGRWSILLEDTLHMRIQARTASPCSMRRWTMPPTVGM